MSKVVEVRYDRFLASGAHRADPLGPDSVWDPVGIDPPGPEPLGGDG
jgi:hypothetical protein